jgi:hypothetical protein
MNTSSNIRSGLGGICAQNVGYNGIWGFAHCANFVSVSD